MISGGHMSKTKQTGQLSINTTNILPIIKKWLYSDHDIFIRGYRMHVMQLQNDPNSATYKMMFR